MQRCNLLLFNSLLLFGVVACDAQKTEQTPEVYLGAGIELQIAENEIAKVFGPDTCQQGAASLNGCTLLSGKDRVSVTVVTSDGQFKEVWTVAHGLGVAKTGIEISRPNGWVLKEPVAN